MTTSPRQQRHVKVHRLLYSRTVKDKHHCHFDQRVEEPVPWIRLQGKWLAKAGFVINTPVTVKVSEGCLVLTTE